MTHVGSSREFMKRRAAMLAIQPGRCGDVSLLFMPVVSAQKSARDDSRYQTSASSRAVQAASDVETSQLCQFSNRLRCAPLPRQSIALRTMHILSA